MMYATTSVLTAALIALSFADYALTAVLVTHYHADELNPFADAVIRLYGLAGLAWFKGLAVALMIGVLSWVNRSHPKAAVIALLWGVGLMSVLVTTVSARFAYILIEAGT